MFMCPSRPNPVPHHGGVAMDDSATNSGADAQIVRSSGAPDALTIHQLRAAALAATAKACRRPSAD
eukprot:6204743-Pleurochrysis_carterae.AAC.3